MHVEEEEEEAEFSGEKLHRDRTPEPRESWNGSDWSLSAPMFRLLRQTELPPLPSPKNMSYLKLWKGVWGTKKKNKKKNPV